MLSHLAITPDGDVIAIGYHAKNRGRSLLVARLAGKDGRLLWISEHDAELHETLEPTSVVVDSDGDVFIGARSWNGSLTMPLFDRWVLKLSATDGHRIWAKREAGKPAPFAAGGICSTPKLLMSSGETLVCVGSAWNGSNVDVRAEWLSGSDGSVIRNITFDGAAHDHDLFRDAALTRSGEVVVALGSSRCPEWMKPLKALRYRLTGGVDWSSVHSETNRVDDADPFNYDSVLWKSLRHPQ
ncbi:MAG: hypothetical protein M3463_22345 [Verrucomicrobiota bacterium]|nr:hypothetical protein [Verrucomicrobiota bacterium]